MSPTFLEYLQEPLALRSLLACLIIGFGNGFMSGLVVLRRSALQLESLSCSLLPGIAIAILLFGLSQWSLLLGAIFAGLIVGLGSLFVSRTSRVNHDTALSVIHVTSFAAGYIILIKQGFQQQVDHWLFGSIMSMSDTDMWIAFSCCTISILLVILFQRPLLIFLFDPKTAQTLGIPPNLFSYGLFTIIIVVLVSSLQAVGAFLTVGLLVAPAASVYLLTNKPMKLFWGGGLIGAMGSGAAFMLSYPLGWHLGASIILVLGAIFLLCYIFSPRYGLLQFLKKPDSAKSPHHDKQ